MYSESVLDKINSGTYKNMLSRPRLKDFIPNGNASYRKASDLYFEEEMRLRNLFRDDLAKENGISLNHPKLERLFGIAWEYGHSAGLQEVANYFEELSDLIT